MEANEIFRRGLSGLGLVLPDRIIDQLCAYLGELQKWNKKINLVAKAPLENLIETHFLDSLTLFPLLENCPDPGLMDIGSGAGFPGLVLKIAFSELPVTLVEPRQKRTAFLRQVIRTLHLEGVTVLETRVEKDSRLLVEFRNAMPVITSRAFASVSNFLELAEPFCAPGGKVICMKSRKATEEIAEWQRLSPSGSFELTDVVETELPFSKIQRKLLIFTANRNDCR